jgi:cytochrome P450 family 9
MKNDNLDAFINEVLRMYPPVVKYDRVASEDVTLTSTGTPLSLKKGTIIRVPIWHMNHNPKYFKDPEIFDPDRFTTENIDEIDMCAFTPFVIGPRTCLGKHLAIMETKCVIFHILKNFRIKKSNKSSVPMTYTPSTVLLKPTNVHVVFERLQEHNNV